MPYAAPRVCTRCRQLAPAGQPCACRAPALGRLHQSAKHQSVAQLPAAKLRANPICEHDGCRLLASEVDHVVPLSAGGDRWAWANLGALCHEHDIDKNVIDAQRGRTKPR